MSYEFKSVADVEVVAEPTESANVLIEENGVIKKAPKTAVGGAKGGEEPDMILELTSANANEYNVTIQKGSYDEIVTLCRSGGFPKVKLMVYGSLVDGGSGVANCMYDGYVSMYYGDLNITAFGIYSAYGSVGCIHVTLYGDESASGYYSEL